MSETDEIIIFLLGFALIVGSILGIAAMFGKFLLACLIIAGSIGIILVVGALLQ